MKKWYYSRTMQLQALQSLQLISGLITANYFPGMQTEVFGACAIIGVALAFAQKVIRVLPSHGYSLTVKQELGRQ